MKKFFLAIFILSILIPLSPTKAQYDQRCWLEKEYGSQLGCEDMGGIFYNTKETEEVCGGAEYIKGKKIGFCQAVGDANTAVSFGGKTKFANFGEFIKFMYNYGIGIAGILAVFMIIIAGAQWILSGGNAERITSARKKISGAIVGLILAVLSYSILNTVNPYLINLRLPQIWMINRQELTPPTCADIEGKRFALAANPGEQVNKNTYSLNNLKEIAQKDLKCGYQYFVEGTGGETCTGVSCDTGQTCYKGPNDNYRQCYKVSVIGTLKASGLVESLIARSALLGTIASVAGDGFEWPWGNEPDIYAVCKNGGYYDVTSDSQSNQPEADFYLNEKDYTQQYWIVMASEEIDEAAKEKCDDEGGFRGFAIGMDLNEEADLGDEEHFFGMDKSNKTAVDLGKEQSETSENIFNKDCVNPYLFSIAELKKGIQLDIDVSKACDIETGSEGEKQRKECYGTSAKVRDLGYEKTKDQCKSS